jgi:hypothetical protein
MKLNAAKRILSNDVIAPAESFKDDNERELHRQQQQRETQEDKEEPNKSSDLNAALRLLALKKRKVLSDINFYNNGEPPVGNG